MSSAFKWVSFVALTLYNIFLKTQTPTGVPYDTFTHGILQLLSCADHPAGPCACAD